MLVCASFGWYSYLNQRGQGKILQNLSAHFGYDTVDEALISKRRAPMKRRATKSLPGEMEEAVLSFYLRWRGTRTQKEVSEELGISGPTLSLFERGKSGAGMRLITALHHASGASFDEIVGFRPRLEQRNFQALVMSSSWEDLSETVRASLWELARRGDRELLEWYDEARVLMAIEHRSVRLLGPKASK